MLSMAKRFSVVRVAQILLLLSCGNNLVIQKDELIDSNYFYFKGDHMKDFARSLGTLVMKMTVVLGVLGASAAHADSFYQVVQGKRYLCTEQAPQPGPGCQYINGAVYCPGPNQTCSYINGSVYCGYSCRYINGSIYCSEQGGRCDYINGSVYCSSLGQSCGYINGAVYCGANCSYVNDSVHCSSGGRAIPSRPASPATPSRGS